jgi:hypothetical protein
LHFIHDYYIGLIDRFRTPGSGPATILVIKTNLTTLRRTGSRTGTKDEQVPPIGAPQVDNLFIFKTIFKSDHKNITSKSKPTTIKCTQLVFCIICILGATGLLKKTKVKKHPLTFTRNAKENKTQRAHIYS